ncbi:MAG TPA: RidA family protein [Thermoleophilaceae bacterium]|nr:RidA family protein [Thermoleophilaceae bacterium]
MSDTEAPGQAPGRHWVRGGEEGLPRVIGPYSLGVRTGSLVYTAGMVPVDSERNIVGAGDIRAQTEQTLRNLSAVLERCGAGLGDVVKVTIWLRDFSDYAGMNEVYGRWFGEPEPVRACVRADLVQPELLVEIEATAVVSE